MTDLGASPALFPIALDFAKGVVSFVCLTEADLAKASFLDGRIAGEHPVVRTIPMAELLAATDGLPERCDFIFHIGHVGSTLLSRLLGHHPDVLAIREPAALRSLAQAPDPSWVGAFLRLWSRTFRPEQRSLLKATSFVSEIAPLLLERPSQPRAICLYVKPETFLATILGGPNSRKEMQGLAPSRWKRLTSRAGEALPPVKSEGDAIAMSWACEMTALLAAKRASERILWLNFERLLDDPPEVLAAAFKHLSVAATQAEVSAISASPDMLRYSKAPEYEYSAALRQSVLNEARASSGGEIRKGLAWLEKASQLQSVRDALELARFN